MAALSTTFELTSDASRLRTLTKTRSFSNFGSPYQFRMTGTGRFHPSKWVAFIGFSGLGHQHKGGSKVGFFGGKSTQCPVCREVLDRKANMPLHNLKHVIPATDGGPGFMWECGCGESDGVWDNKAGAAAGLTKHMEIQHDIRPF
jgi:hypothetical protein